VAHRYHVRRFAILAFILASASPGNSQNAPSSGPPAQANEPPVRSLSDVKPGVSRAAVLTGLASDYTLTKEVMPKDFPGELELWQVVGKMPPYVTAEVSFVQGKAFSIRSDLLISTSPDVVKFVDTLQSALYDSTNPPSETDAATLARWDWTRHMGSPPDEAQLAMAERVQMELWKMDNQRFGTAQIGASQHHSPEWDERKLSVVIGGGSFEIRLRTLGGQTVVDLSEIKQ